MRKARPEETVKMKVRNLAALLALSSVAVLPACSWLGIDDNNRQTSRAAPASQSYAAAPASQTSAPELTPDMIRSVQQNLQQGGLYHGRVDGVWGPSTQAAVRSYQQQHNMNATGQLDQATLSAMNLAPGQNNAQEQPANQTYGSNDNPQPSNPNPPNTNTTR
jgi:peptidoglycan hydrolase-like protein with peptidoglycan-binding domain